jgi:hypothetical protein
MSTSLNERNIIISNANRTEFEEFLVKMYDLSLILGIYARSYRVQYLWATNSFELIMDIKFTLTREPFLNK